MSAIEIFLAKGKQGLLLHKDQLTREEKRVVRERFGPEGSSGIWFLEVPNEPEDEPQQVEVAVVSPVETREPVEPPLAPVNRPEVPEELEALTVAQLKEMAYHQEIDISGLKNKADLVGRIWAVREEREEG